jgi:hypothetical protein
MVTQRPLEALFLVRVQAGQLQILSNRYTVSEIRWNRSHFHSRIETHESAKRRLFVNYSSKDFGAIDGFSHVLGC